MGEELFFSLSVRTELEDGDKVGLVQVVSWFKCWTREEMHDNENDRIALLNNVI